MVSRWFSIALFGLSMACDESPPGSEPGDALSCTEIGCSDGLEGRFSPEIVTQGEYLFTLDIEGQVTTCTVTLPLAETHSCDAPLQIMRSGSALPETEHSLPGFSIFEAGFVSYTLTIALDGVEIVSVTEEPDWATVQPNGEGCEPVCEMADSTVVLP
jgi:hypothetical protein